MIVRVGGVSVRLTIRRDAAGPRAQRIAQGVRERLSRFIESDGRHDLALTVRLVGDLPWGEILRREDLTRVRRIVRVLEGRFPFTKIRFDDAHNNGQGGKASSMNGETAFGSLSGFDEGNISVIPQPGLLLAVDHTRRRGEVIVKGTGEQDIVPSVVNALQGALALCAPDHGGLMLHASSVAIDGGGYLFLGGSGAGKSTIAASMSPETVLSDDGSWCSRDGAGYSLFPTPFSRIDPGAVADEGSPLKRVLVLEKSERDYIADLSPGRAMTMLLLNHIHFFRFFRREGALNAFGLVAELCRTHPVSTLFFNRNFNPIPFFRGTGDERKKAV